MTVVTRLWDRGGLRGPVLGLGLAALVLAAPMASPADTVDTAFSAYWQASGPEEAQAAAARIVAAGGPFDEVLSRLRAGRRYSGDVPRGVVRLSHELHGKTFHYTIDVPADYDPSRRWQVRVQLHGGVTRPDDSVRGDGSIGALAGADQIYVLPIGWGDAPWWSEEQVESLTTILDRLKRTYNVDENRIVLSGHSDGATAVFYFAMRDTTPFASFLPLNGFIKVLANQSLDIHEELFPNNMRNKPWFVVNGGKDPLFPAAIVEPYLTRFRQAGLDLDYHPQPDGEHNTRWWPEVKDAFEAFVAAHPRTPNPATLTWETDVTGSSARAHWLVVDALAPRTSAEPLPDLNELVAGTQMNFGVRSRGMQVTEVVRDSGADGIGLRPGDLVTSINGRVLPAGVDLTEMLELIDPQTPLTLGVVRDKAAIVLTGTYAPRELPRVVPIFEHVRPSGRVDLVREGNLVRATTRGVSAFTLLLAPDVFDFTKPIVVIADGRTIFEGRVSPDVATLVKWAARDNDRTMLYAAELHLIM
jgi:hypothetical protein